MGNKLQGARVEVGDGGCQVSSSERGDGEVGGGPWREMAVLKTGFEWIGCEGKVLLAAAYR